MPTELQEKQSQLNTQKAILPGLEHNETKYQQLYQEATIAADTCRAQIRILEEQIAALG